MRDKQDSITTFLPYPLHVAELRRLPQFGGYGNVVLCGESLRELFWIELLMKDLAPVSTDDKRSLWIETIRGEPLDWGCYHGMTSSEVSSRKEFLELWRFANPDEVTWWRVDTFSYKDTHTLMITDGRGYITTLVNRRLPSDSILPDVLDEDSPDVHITLRRLAEYLERLRSSILEDPDPYNTYLDAHLPRCFRTGRIPLKEYRRITGMDSHGGLPEVMEAYLERKASGSWKECLMDGPMTLGFYTRAWMTGYRALYGGVPSLAWDSNGDDFQAFQAINGEFGIAYDPDSPEDFERWKNGVLPGHAFELTGNGGVAIYPETVSGYCLMCVRGKGEGAIRNLVLVARALDEAGILAWVPDAADIFKFIRGEMYLTFDPRGEAGMLNPQCRFPERPSEEYPQEVIQALDKATEWTPLKRVIPLKDIL